MGSQTDKTVFITGATSGFGAACARRYAKEGYRLILTGRRAERLQALQRELDVVTTAHCLAFDIRDKDAVQNAVANLPAGFRDIDILINNAGLALGLERAHAADLNDWETMVDTNIKGLIYCTHTVLPGMAERNRGHIVNVGSVAGNWPYPGGNVYGATKAFVKQFSHNLRADLQGTRIRVTNIEPGLAETEFSVVRFKGDSKKAGDFYKGTKPLTAEEIAEIIFWITAQPEHININRIEVMPVCQSWGPFAIHRKEG